MCIPLAVREIYAFERGRYVLALFSKFQESSSAESGALTVRDILAVVPRGRFIQVSIGTRKGNPQQVKLQRTSEFELSFR